MPRSIVIFLLIASFGILFAGCGQPKPDTGFEEFTFSDQDLQRVQEIVAGASSSASMNSSASSMASTTLTDASGSSMMTASSTPTLSATDTVVTTSMDMSVKLNPDLQHKYDGWRLSLADQSGNLYRVNNPFLNVRAQMSVSSPLVVSLKQGDPIVVIEVPNGEWAKVRMTDGKEGYVATRYIAKVTTEQRLAEDKKQFEGKYYVDYAFLNIRKEASTQAEKIGEIPGNAIVKPLSINGEWAKVSFGGNEGYVSAQYLSPLQPVFLVRQEDYSLPMLQFAVTDQASIDALAKDITALKAASKKMVTLKTFYDLVQTQESRDARPEPNSIVLLITGVKASNIHQVTDMLDAASAKGTLFISTREIGVAGITEKMILNAMANGNELMAMGHTGDDMRSLTDSQVAQELSQSKQMLEAITKREVYAVAYPGGGVNDRVMKKAAEIGYLFGITQNPDKKFNRSQFLRLPSVYVTGTMSAEEVVKTLQ